MWTKVVQTYELTCSNNQASEIARQRRSCRPLSSPGRPQFHGKQGRCGTGKMQEGQELTRACVETTWTRRLPHRYSMHPQARVCFSTLDSGWSMPRLCGWAVDDRSIFSERCGIFSERCGNLPECHTPLLFFQFVSQVNVQELVYRIQDSPYQGFSASEFRVRCLRIRFHSQSVVCAHSTLFISVLVSSICRPRVLDSTIYHLTKWHKMSFHIWDVSPFVFIIVSVCHALSLTLVFCVQVIRNFMVLLLFYVKRKPTELFIFLFYLIINRWSESYESLYMSVGVMKDYKLRNLCASHKLVWSLSPFFFHFFFRWLQKSGPQDIEGRHGVDCKLSRRSCFVYCCVSQSLQDIEWIVSSLDLAVSVAVSRSWLSIFLCLDLALSDLTLAQKSTMFR
jgi:hypothetical protein